MAIKAQPKSVGSNFPDRYEGKYDAKATIESVEAVKSDGPSNGAIAVHLKGKLVYDNGTSKTVHLVDWFGHRNKNTDKASFAQQFINRAANAQLSAGEKCFDGEIDENNESELRKTVYKIFKQLVNKEVFVHQYTPKNKETGELYAHPNINYLFGEDAVVDDDEAEADEDEDLPF